MHRRDPNPSGNDVSISAPGERLQKSPGAAGSALSPHTPCTALEPEFKIEGNYSRWILSSIQHHPSNQVMLPRPFVISPSPALPCPPPLLLPQTGVAPVEAAQFWGSREFSCSNHFNCSRFFLSPLPPAPSGALLPSNQLQKHGNLVREGAC